MLGSCYSEVNFPILHTRKEGGKDLVWEFAHGSMRTSAFPDDGIKFNNPNAPFKCGVADKGNVYKCTKNADAQPGRWTYAINTVGDKNRCLSYDPVIIND